MAVVQRRSPGRCDIIVAQVSAAGLFRGG